MESKFFRCYFCKTNNNYLVPADQNGKECKCCQAFNYFQKNNNNNYNNNKYNKKKKGYKYKKFYNQESKIKKNEVNSNGNYEGTHNNFYKNYNNFNEDLNDDIHQESNLFSRGFNSSINSIYNNNNNTHNNPNYRVFKYNNIFDTQPNPFTYNNISNGNDYNLLNNNFNIQNNQKSNYNFKKGKFKPKPRRNSKAFFQNLYYKVDDEEDKKEDIKKEEEDDDDKSLYNYNKFIKYIWLKKEKMTKELLDKEYNGNQCSVCLRNIKLNHDINITKCGHVFHYKCIEEVIGHYIYVCPNCRCNLKTEEKQKNYDKENNVVFRSMNIDIISDDFSDSENFI